MQSEGNTGLIELLAASARASGPQPIPGDLDILTEGGGEQDVWALSGDPRPGDIDTITRSDGESDLWLSQSLASAPPTPRPEDIDILTLDEGESDGWMSGR
jgi:hypothetical protein